LGAYFACYGLACNSLSRSTNLSPSAIAFVGGGIAAAGSSVVKVPIAVCIRSVQAGVYPNAVTAARSILAATGPRGLFTVCTAISAPSARSLSLQGLIKSSALAVCLQVAPILSAAPVASLPRSAPLEHCASFVQGYVPTLLEDVPDMAFKFAAYETLKQAHRAAVGGRDPSMAEARPPRPQPRPSTSSRPT
jgi:hypothetical protein